MGPDAPFCHPWYLAAFVPVVGREWQSSFSGNWLQAVVEVAGPDKEVPAGSEQRQPDPADKPVDLPSMVADNSRRWKVDIEMSRNRTGNTRGSLAHMEVWSDWTDDWAGTAVAGTSGQGANGET
jgi:hypothetical protein